MYRFMPVRKLSSSRKPSGSEIRQTFIDFFVKEHKHTFIKSSSVIPYGDPSVAFVNAGMNQFKSVLLGLRPPPVPRATNSQKCIRVGGKHNDLEAVGKDGSHHTFFEMLGNWSFGDYFKREACSMAWHFLTGPLKLDPSQLVVTYFGGDEKSGLPPDFESAHVWRQLGVQGEQLQALGMKDNFWEMGPVGPCGPCTEIHLRHPDGLLELWNLVFIQYERKHDQGLTPLGTYHVDTGMGLERITKVLQNVATNYDTDLFTPLFDLIHKASRAPRYSGQFGDDSQLDCAYRVLADHSRAVSVALADGMFPDQNHKLRRLLRRCLLISEQDFNQQGPNLLSDLITLNSQTLGQVYPELVQSLSRCLHLIGRESEIFNQSRAQARHEWQKIVKINPELATLQGDHPGLVAALAELKGKKELTGETAFKLYDTYGLETSTIEQLSEILRLPVDLAGMEKCIETQQAQSRVVSANEERILTSLNIAPTEDSLKYAYTLQEDVYVFPQDVKCRVLAMLSEDNEVLRQVTVGQRAKVVLDRTCLYAEAGGQVADRGELKTETGRATIDNVHKSGQYVVHYITVTDGTIHINDNGTLELDCTLRLGSMQHHTATHLLNSALHQLVPYTYQRSSHVTSNYLTFDFTIDKEKLSNEDITFIENYVSNFIKLQLEVERTLIRITELPQNSTLIPGENYPDEITILKITNHDQLMSLEPCCGTHVHNTKHIVDFCIVSEKSSGLGVRSVRALAGTSAVMAKLEVFKLNQQLNKLIINWSIDNLDFSIQIQDFKRRFVKIDLPLLERLKLAKKLEELEKKVSESYRQLGKLQLEREMTAALSHTDTPYVVCAMRSEVPEVLPLVKANAMSLPHRASFVFSVDLDNNLRGRCVVPKSLISASFDAEKWVNAVLTALNAVGAPIKGQDTKLVYSIKPKKLQKDKQDEILSMAVNEANKFVKSFS